MVSKEQEGTLSEKIREAFTKMNSALMNLEESLKLVNFSCGEITGILYDIEKAKEAV